MSSERSELRPNGRVVFALAFKTFSKVRHDRDRCKPDLFTQAKVFGESPCRCDTVDLSRQRTSLLPSDQIFELPHFLIPHCSYLVTHHSLLTTHYSPLIAFHSYRLSPHVSPVSLL